MARCGFFKGAIIGGAIAGVAALLFAPKKGSELREDIKNKYDDAHKDLSEQLAKAKKTADGSTKELIEKSEKVLAALDKHSEEVGKTAKKGSKVAGDEFKILTHQARELAAQLSASTNKVVKATQKEYQKVTTPPAKKPEAKKSTPKKTVSKK